MNLKDLSKMAKEELKKKHPNVPEHALPPHKYSDKNANELTKSIIDYLRFNGWYAVRINTQGQYNQKLGRWTKSTTTKGTADIHACINGNHVSIEVKAGKDKQSDYQKETEEKVKMAGGVYVIARTFDDFIQWVTDTTE